MPRKPRLRQFKECYLGNFLRWHGFDSVEVHLELQIEDLNSSERS